MATKEFGLKSRTIDEAWIAYRELYFRLEDEDTDLAPGLRPLRKRLKQAKGE